MDKQITPENPDDTTVESATEREAAERRTGGIRAGRRKLGGFRIIKRKLGAVKFK